MRIKRNPRNLLVDPDFKDLIKVEAAKKGKNMVDYTRDLARDSTPLDDIAKGWDRTFKKRGRGFERL